MVYTCDLAPYGAPAMVYTCNLAHYGGPSMVYTCDLAPYGAHAGPTPAGRIEIWDLDPLGSSVNSQEPGGQGAGQHGST